MSRRRLTKPGWLILGGLLLLGLLGFGLPPMLRSLEFFRVRRIEFVGATVVRTSQLLDHLGLPDTVSLFDSFDEIPARLAQVPGVREVRVRRRLPGTLRIEITQGTPVAVSPGPQGMTIVDDRGRALRFDPGSTTPDLPVMREPDSLAAGLLARIRRVDPELFQRAGVVWRSGGDVVLEVEGRRYWFRPDATAEAILAVSAVAADLAGKGRTFRELDGRFAGQVVVRGMGA